MSNNPPLRFSHSHHLLSVKGCDAGLDVLAFEGDEALSTPFSYRTEFTSADHAISKEIMLMKAASLTLQAPVDQGYGIKIQQPVRVIQGVVTGFKRLGTSKDETRYAVTLEPRLALLSRSHQNAIYQDMSVPQIVEKILRERHGMRGQDFLFSLSKEYPRREQVMQYAEDDLHFITRLLGEVGIWFRFTTDTRLNIDVVEFYDSRQGYEKGLTLPSVPPSGQHSQGVDSVWDMECRHKVVQKAVSTRDYNYRQATQDMNTLVDATRGDVTTYGEAYHWADNYLTPGSAYDRNPAAESGAFYARIRHERYLNDQTQTVAFTSCPELSPGMLLKVTGGYEVAEVFAQGVVVTAMHSHAQRDADFCVRFDGIPDSPDFSFRPEPGSRPVMAGTLPARVTSTTENDTYGHIDKDGRYRVNMLFDRENWETGFESLWVRQSRPYAGDTYGLHLPLLAGTEVAIGFEGGNPDRPYIAGVLHDSAHGDHVTIRNYRRNVLRTPANNKIRLDDERGKEHIKVSTEYGGKSQLNLGHLVDSEKQQRGEGFELRTDSWGAIRAQKGIFISADGQAKAQGQVLDMEPALARLSAALVEMESLAACAQQAQALAADVGRQQKLLKQKIEQLHEEVILGSAPKGMALVSGEDMQLSASDNMTLTAGKQLDVGAQNDFTLAAGKQLSLYSREGAKLFSSQNDIDIQAQGGNITTWSTQDTHVSSGRKMVITAQDELTLICGGGYIKINGGNVEIGGPGKLLIKNTGIRKAGTGSMQGVMKSFEPSTFDEKFVITHPVSGKPLANQNYDIHLPDGKILSGVTDSSGNSSLIMSKAIDGLKIVLKK
ncbi:type VI secretion system tip protein VgrG [Enterobacter hormaechei]|uniref:type VI secretion system Vgr family protein n=3 Tax=Enterobacter cloacae complex TaxID=354276 RepID=UPI00190ABFF0|nr:type VI secretion system Vgr family protein [Enterobacter hormaechei]ELS4528301.1 type VI secretion system tip protein VgrG [Enterobacter hormaechei]MBK2401428.1 type VI secretion system tip protein VgrG [Enterobacter hormaechei]MDV1206924.1 type VI secretion system tip protein VgrG [Enterobacter hormaechei]MDV1248311.1 type VI secretion system tip protein VgrG [Enterobacter hormaechei]MDV1274482.1 type VI secretion system tip protein VgrG [Enterobacter hormaechei]